MMRWSIASVCMGGGAGGQARRRRQGRLSRRRNVRERPDLLQRQGARRAPHGGRPRPRNRRAAAAARFRGRRRSRSARRNFERAARKLELMRDLGARAALPLLQRLAPMRSATPSALRPRISRNSPISPGRRACASATRRSPGAAMSRTGPRRGRSSARPTATISASCSTASTSARAATRSSRSPPAGRQDRARPGRRRAGAARWTRCRSAGTIAAIPARATFRSSTISTPSTRTGYRGPLSLEIFNDQFRGASASAIAVDGMRSLRVAGEALARATRRSVATRRLPISRPFRRRPSSSAPEFLEFAASDGDAQALAALIEGLGFRLAGRHRSKEVDLYRQGEVDLVVNREREGFAHFVPVAARPLGLRAGAAGRLRRQGAGARRRARVPELCRQDRAGRGDDPGGRAASRAASSISSAQKIPTGGPISSRSRRSAGAAFSTTSIISPMSCAAGEFLGWSLFYRRRARTRRRSRRSRSPIRTAPSSAAPCAAPTTALRIALNIGEGGATGVSRFLDAFGGAGYQQIAISTDDIFAAVEAARAAGRRLPADPRQLLRRSRDPLRHRAGPARPHARARRALRSREGWRVLPHLHADVSTTASSSRSSSAAITICSARPTRPFGLPRRRASTEASRARGDRIRTRTPCSTATRGSSPTSAIRRRRSSRR